MLIKNKMPFHQIFIYRVVSNMFAQERRASDYNKIAYLCFENGTLTCAGRDSTRWSSRDRTPDIHECLWRQRKRLISEARGESEEESCLNLEARRCDERPWSPLTSRWIPKVPEEWRPVKPPAPTKSSSGEFRVCLEEYTNRPSFLEGERLVSEWTLMSKRKRKVDKTWVAKESLGKTSARDRHKLKQHQQEETRNLVVRENFQESKSNFLFGMIRFQLRTFGLERNLWNTKELKYSSPLIIP